MTKYDSLRSKGIRYCDTSTSAIHEIDRLIGTGSVFGVDTETKTLDPHTGKLRLVQISDNQNQIGFFDTWKIEYV